MALELNDRLSFGKNKGKTVQQVFVENPGYLCWLRDQRKLDNADTKFFSPAVLQLLDEAIKDSASLKKKHEVWNVPIPPSYTAPEITVDELAEYDEVEAAYKAKLMANMEQSIGDLRTTIRDTQYSQEWGSF